MSKKRERAGKLRKETEALVGAMSSLSEQEKYLVSLEAWARMLLGELQERRLSQAAVSLDLLSSISSAHDGGLRHSDLRDAYPVKAWREDTVEVPRAWVNSLVEGWRKYRLAGPETNLGEVLGVEGGGQGQQPARVAFNNLRQDVHRYNAVSIEQRAGALDGTFLSQEQARASVAESLGLSDDAVKRSVSRVRRKKGE